MALAAAGFMPDIARADFPGALWSVDQVAVTVAPGASVSDADALSARVGAGLRRANDTYFYGERAAKMTVRILSDSAMTVALVDRRTGAVVTRVETLSPDADLSAAALRWMDGLSCATLDCMAPGAGSTALAAAAPAPQTATPDKVAVARTPQGTPTANTPTTDTPTTGLHIAALTPGALAHHEQPADKTSVPVPAPRPSQVAAFPKGLGRIQVARSQPADLDRYAEPIRIARFNTDQLGRLSYTPADKLVLATPRKTLSDAPQPASRESSTAVGRFFDSVARLFGFGEPTPRPEQPAPALALAAQPSAQAGATTAVTATRTTPSVRSATPWRLETTPDVSRTPTGPRIAALSTPGTTTELERPSAYRGLRIVPSPGLLPPRNREAAAIRNPAIVTPIRVAAAPVTTTTRNISVRLDKELLGRYAPGAFDRLFNSYQNDKAKVVLVAGRDESGQRNRTVDTILAARGLALDAERFAKAERVFWGGKTGSRKFWISLPQVSPSRYVLVASDTASVIARVHSSGNSVRVSDAVAKALGMQAGTWSDVQIVALRETERAQRRRERVRIVR